jgi:hypothetical protein
MIFFYTKYISMSNIRYIELSIEGLDSLWVYYTKVGWDKFHKTWARSDFSVCCKSIHNILRDCVPHVLRKASTHDYVGVFVIFNDNELMHRNIFSFNTNSHLEIDGFLRNVLNRSAEKNLQKKNEKKKRRKERRRLGWFVSDILG